MTRASINRLNSSHVKNYVRVLSDNLKISFLRGKTVLMIFYFVSLFIGFSSCNEDILTEEPTSFLSPVSALKDKASFESAISALHEAARIELVPADATNRECSMYAGTDQFFVFPGSLTTDFLNYDVTLTPAYAAGNHYWEWAYLKMFPRANMIIEYAEDPDVEWTSEAEKNAIVAEAKFLRAYAYNALANIYGGVPIVEILQKEPKIDYVRATRTEVLEFAKKDLEFAAQWLPEVASEDGRIAKGAANHLLAEVYISLGEYDNAIQSASTVINSGTYKLMDTRFGKYVNLPGDPFSDMFKDGGQNRSGGNLETIWAMQIEFQTPGGGHLNANGEYVYARGNILVRHYAPSYYRGYDPDGKSGFVLVDSLGRSPGYYRPTNYFLYDLWKNNWSDMRNSAYNILRTFKYTNPASTYFGQVVTYHPKLDTMWHVFPYIKKIAGEALAGNDFGRTFNDYIIFRLAETYLLRAEAYLMKGDKQKAADDINVVRSRAKAPSVGAAQVDIDFILDERSRELVLEEPRRRTLVRTGKLVERVKKYNLSEETRSSIKDYHVWFPIPQKAIDANFGAKLDQNPGYN